MVVAAYISAMHYNTAALNCILHMFLKKAKVYLQLNLVTLAGQSESKSFYEEACKTTFNSFACA